jgi:hypothetical protein
MAYKAIKKQTRQSRQPRMTEREFIDWSQSDSYFESLWLDYEEAGFPKDFSEKPWCVFVDYKLGYTIGNIQWLPFSQKSNPRQFNYTPMSQQEREEAVVTDQAVLKLNEELSKRQQEEYQKKIQELANRKKAAEDFIKGL